MKYVVSAKRTIEYTFLLEAFDEIDAKQAIRELNRGESTGDNCDLRDRAYEGNIRSDSVRALLDK